MAIESGIPYLQQQAIHLLEVNRGHWKVMQMREQILALAKRWGWTLSSSRIPAAVWG
jgi:hypothetical protein